MMIVPDLRAIPFAPTGDDNLDALRKALQGGKITRASFRYTGSPRPLEPKIDFTVQAGDETRHVTVVYGPKTLELLESQDIPVENIPRRS